MIKLLNKVIPLAAIVFVVLLGLLVVPPQIDRVTDLTNNLYGAGNQPGQTTPDDPGPGTTDPGAQPSTPTDPGSQTEAPKFTEEQVGKTLVEMVGQYGLNVNGLTAQGDGSYTIHIYGDKSILNGFLEGFGRCELEPKIGDFSIRESSTYFFLMNAKSDSGQPLLYTGSFYDLFSNGNPQVMQQMESLANTQSSSQYYLVLTFFVNPA